MPVTVKDLIGDCDIPLADCPDMPPAVFDSMRAALTKHTGKPRRKSSPRNAKAKARK